MTGIVLLAIEKNEKLVFGPTPMGTFSLTFKPGDPRGMVVAVVCLTIVLAVDIFTIPLHYEQWQTKNWDRTPGTVDDIYIWEDCGGDDGCTYGLQVEYSYEVDGVRHESDQISLVDWEDSTDSSLGWKEDFERDHPRFSAIDVYVDPKNSERSVLITGFSVGSGAITNIAILSCCNFFLLFIGLGSAGNANPRIRTKLERIGFGFPQADWLEHSEEPEDESEEYSVGQSEENSETSDESPEEVGWWEDDDGAERGI